VTSTRFRLCFSGCGSPRRRAASSAKQFFNCKLLKIFCGIICLARGLPCAASVSHPEITATDHEQRIVQELLQYLAENPGAMDTLDGIAAWWLPRHEARVGVEFVARALARLEAEGVIERTGDPGRPMFHLRRTPAPLTNGAHPVPLDA
jgi:hypothetical protein